MILYDKLPCGRVLSMSVYTHVQYSLCKWRLSFFFFFAVLYDVWRSCFLDLDFQVQLVVSDFFCWRFIYRDFFRRFVHTRRDGCKYEEVANAENRLLLPLRPSCCIYNSLLGFCVRFVLFWVNSFFVSCDVYRTKGVSGFILSSLLCCCLFSVHHFMVLRDLVALFVRIVSLWRSFRFRFV